MEEGKEKQKSVRDEFAEKFISILESDKPLEWVKGWSSGSGVPCNGESNRKYNGVNRLVLMMASYENGWSDHRFYSFNQVTQMENCKVKAGSKATRIEYWMMYDTKEKRSLKIPEYNQYLKDNLDRKEEEFRPYAKAFYVFNAEQIEGIQPLGISDQHDLEPNVLAEEVIKTLSENMGVGVAYGADGAYYSPSSDCIRLPSKESFFSEGELYGTTLHEFAHASGTADRLNRPLSSYYADSQLYAREELIAEIASTFMSAEIGIEMSESVIENHKAYVQSWLSQIKEDHNVLFSAIKQADRVTDYLMDVGRVELLREQLTIEQNMPKQLDGKSYEIWQLKDIPENELLHFTEYAYASKFRLSESRYEKVYEATVTEETDSLDKLYYKFNVEKPEGYKGHSMSMSDIVVLNQDGKRSAWYCDSIGFKEVPEFCISPKIKINKRCR